jgi:hypothetical protein
MRQEGSNSGLNTWRLARNKIVAAVIRMATQAAGATIFEVSVTRSGSVMGLPETYVF